MNFLRFIIHTNIFISLGAVALTWETQVLLGMAPQWHPYLFIIFFATIFEYNLHRLITVITNPQALNDSKHSWVKNHTLAFYSLAGLSILGFLISAALAKKAVLLALFPIGLITLFYSLPVFRTRYTIFRLREIPGLKLFLIAFVWAASTILLPLIQSGQPCCSWHIACMLAERILFVMAITLPFDIRDMKADRESGLKTIPLFLGEKKTIRLALILLLAFIILSSLHYVITKQFFALPAFAISFLSTGLFILNEKIKRMPYYHYFVLDGTLLLQGLLVCLCFYAR